MRRRFVPLAAAGLLAIVFALAPTPHARAQDGPVPGIPFIDHAVAYPDTDGGSWSLALRGHFPDSVGCWWTGRMSREGYNVLLYRIEHCPEPLPDHWMWKFDLGQLRPGHYSIQLTLGVDEQISDSLPPRLHHGVFEFDVQRDTIPPPPSWLPYTDSIVVASANAPGPICSGDSIRVSLRGRFPNVCYHVKRVSVLPVVSPHPSPPVIQIVVERAGCFGFCESDGSWSVSVDLPPLRPGQYLQRVSMLEVDCAHGDSVVARHRAAVPFQVRSDCGPPESCLLGDFLGPERGDQCDAFVAPGDPADLTFGVLTFRDLAGLQGSFTLHPAGLRIASLEAVGAASGMRLDWVRTTTGARFTLFAESGAPIGACPEGALCIPQPVLRLTVAADSTPARVTLLAFHDLLGSTIDGTGVPECPIVHADRIAFPGARICAAGGECDFNADGRSDVRDLVLMVHCVNQTGACPPGGAFDCNGDGFSSLADVICCARHILRRNPACPECPPDTLRPAPQVRASLGEAIHSETGAELPLTLVGAEHVGGALFELSYPTDRYEATAEMIGRSSSWLDLHETRDGKLVVGLVRLGPVLTLDVDQRVEVRLRLTLKPGQSPGGEVSCTSSEFSGADGAMLRVSLGTLEQPLLGAAKVQLSGARPNPTGGETSFALTLDRASRVEVGVYDLGGRRIATIHRGTMTAGEHVLRWNGRGDDGAAAPSGVYFYRASAGASVASRKLVLMREP
jgi:hypothetical protein